MRNLSAQNLYYTEKTELSHSLIPPRPYPTYEWYLRARGDLPLSRARDTNQLAFINELVASGLRGRGGAGFPTGQKWLTLFNHSCPTRYVVCNAAEGEPGTFKDRFLLRKNPYAVLEGIALATEAIRAKAAYIAIKSSFQKEIAILETAIQQMMNLGFFRKIPLHLVKGPEEYLFGEEKAILNVIENEGPFPRTPEEPPYEVGLFASPLSPNPALVNNVETFAHVATIARHGPESFRKLGTLDTPGKILCTLSGAVAKPGIYELEAGLTIDEILHHYGGGPLKRRRWKALLPGVSAPVILPSQFHTRVNFQSLKEIGSGLGSAGFIVLDDSIPIPAVAEAVTRFLFVESCNQCSACKAGLRQAWTGLDQGRSQKFDEDLLLHIREGAESAPQGNRCYLPVQGATLVPSLLKHFPEEFAGQKLMEKWPIPKMVDFDEMKGIFYYDENQPFKQADWSYAKDEEPAVQTEE